jgi:hypothetical protein
LAVAKGPRLLHTIALLHSLGTARSGSGSGERRRRQHLNIAQRLLDPLPEGLRPQDAASTLFWRILRWGGLGLLEQLVNGRSRSTHALVRTAFAAFPDHLLERLRSTACCVPTFPT